MNVIPDAGDCFPFKKIKFRKKKGKQVPKTVCRWYASWLAKPQSWPAGKVVPHAYPYAVSNSGLSAG